MTHPAMSKAAWRANSEPHEQLSTLTKALKRLRDYEIDLGCDIKFHYRNGVVLGLLDLEGYLVELGGYVSEEDRLLAEDEGENGN